jgi:hypothetical protein
VVGVPVCHDDSHGTGITHGFDECGHVLVQGRTRVDDSHFAHADEVRPRTV